MSRVVDIDELVPGNVVAEDVINSQGMVLLMRGISLEEKHKKILLRWGIKKITISEASEAGSEDGRSPEEVIQEKTEAIQNELKEKFTDHENNPLMMELKKTVQDFRVEQIKEKL